MNDLKRTVNDLNIRKQDLELRKEAEIHCRKVVKKEVEKWFEDVQSMNTEMQKIEEKFRVVSFFSRACLGKLVCQKTEEVRQFTNKVVSLRVWQLMGLSYWGDITDNKSRR